MLDAGGFRDIAASMRRHKTRTAPTALSIFWAVLTLMVLLGSGIWVFVRNTAEAHNVYPPGHRILLSERAHATLISHGNRAVSIGVSGVADDYFEIKLNRSYLQEQRLNALDGMARRKVVAIGTRAASLVLPDLKNPIGQFIGINGIPFQIVGVFDDPAEEGSFSGRIYMPLTAFKHSFGNDDTIPFRFISFRTHHNLAPTRRP